MKYAVAVFRFSAHKNRIKVVEAETPLDAVFMAVGQKPEDYSIEFKDIEDIFDELYAQGFAASVPLRLEAIAHEP